MTGRVEISALTRSAKARPDGSARLHFTITNTASTTVEATLAPDGDLPPGFEGRIIDGETRRLEGRETAQIEMIAQLPPGTPAGDYPIRMRADVDGQPPARSARIDLALETDVPPEAAPKPMPAAPARQRLLRPFVWLIRSIAWLFRLLLALALGRTGGALSMPQGGQVSMRQVKLWLLVFLVLAVVCILRMTAWAALVEDAACRGDNPTADCLTESIYFPSGTPCLEGDTSPRCVMPDSIFIDDSGSDPELTFPSSACGLGPFLGCIGGGG